MQSVHLNGQGPCSSHCRLENDSLVRAVWQAVHCFLLASSIVLFRTTPRKPRGQEERRLKKFTELA